MAEAINTRSWELRKRISVTVIVLCILCCMSFGLVSTYAVYADDDTDDGTISGEVLFELLDDIFGVSTIEYELSDDNVTRNTTSNAATGHSKLYVALTEDSSSGGGANLISSASDTIKDLAYFFLFLIIAIKAIQEASRGDPTLETWLRMFMIVIVGIIFIEYSDTIFDYLSNLGDRFLYRIHESITSAEAADALDGLDDDTLSGIKGWKRIVARLLIWACKFSIVIPAWALFYELLIRRIFAPIAVVDIAAEGTHSNGVRFMKNYFGIYVRVAIMYICVYLMTALLNQIQSAYWSGYNWFEKLLCLVGIIFGGSSIMTKSNGLVKEILGA